MTRRILVTGGAGFIGANFVHYWRRTRPADRIIVLDKLTYAGNLANLEPLIATHAIAFVHGDIGAGWPVGDLLARERLDTIVHFAAETHVDRSIENPAPFIATNIQGTHDLLVAAKDAWLGPGARRATRDDHRFHHISTDEVYGTLEPDDPPSTEESRYAPNSPYAASKAAADHLVRAYHRTYGLRVTTTNCSNNYGPYQFVEKLLPLMLINGLEGKPLPIYGDGLQRRDWLFVDDHCAAIARVLDAGAIGETYNVGTGYETANLDAVHLVCSEIDRAFAAEPELIERFPNAPAARGERTMSLITHVADRPGHDRRYALDGGKLRRDLGFVPPTPFRSGLEHTVRWYLDHEAWWRSPRPAR